MRKMPPFTKKEFESKDSMGESKDLKDNLHIKEEFIMKNENNLSENEGNEVQSEVEDRTSG